MSKMTKRRVTTETSASNADQELLNHLTVKAVKTLAWEKRQRERHHELYQALFSTKKPSSSTPAKDHTRLAQLVVAYQANFGTHVPLEAMKVLQVIDLVPILLDALATNTPLAETGWGGASLFEFSPRGCIVRDESPEPATPTKGPDGEWLQ